MNVTCGRCGTLDIAGSRCRKCGDQLHHYREEPRKTRAKRFPLVLTLVFVVPIAIIVFFKVVYNLYLIPSGSMEPTLHTNDVLLVNRLAYLISAPKDGDIVVFDAPVPATKPFVKRVIASPGETLRIHNGRLYRNAAAVNESYIAQPTAYELEIKNYGIYVDGVPLEVSESNIPPRRVWTSPDRLPRGCYILLGDNRNNSEGSQIWGFAQHNGSFYSGPRAGRSAGSFEKVVKIINRSDRDGSF